MGHRVKRPRDSSLFSQEQDQTGLPETLSKSEKQKQANSKRHHAITIQNKERLSVNFRPDNTRLPFPNTDRLSSGREDELCAKVSPSVSHSCLGNPFLLFLHLLSYKCLFHVFIPVVLDRAHRCCP